MKHWNYKGVADITIGEVQTSKAPKIILAVVIVLISILITLGIYFREYIKDFFIAPEIILSDDYITLELNADFNAEDYILNHNAEYEILNADIDTSILNAEYIVTYNTWNKVSSNSVELKVRIIDDIAPSLKLKSNNKKIILDEANSFTLISGKSTDTNLGTDNFNLEKDISVEVSDNHTSKEDLLKSLKITPKELDFSLDTNEVSKNINITYEITDNSGLSTKAYLIILVVNGQSEISTPPVSSSSTPSYTPPDPPLESDYTPTESSSPPVYNPPTPTTPYIHGVHDIVVPVGTGLQQIVNELIDGVYGSGYISVEYRRVNPTIEGEYTVTFTSSDGVTEYCTVTVI